MPYHGVQAETDSHRSTLPLTAQVGHRQSLAHYHTTWDNKREMSTNLPALSYRWAINTQRPANCHATQQSEEVTQSPTGHMDYYNMGEKEKQNTLSIRKRDGTGDTRMESDSYLL